MCMDAAGVDHLHALMAQLEGVFKERGTPARQRDVTCTSRQARAVRASCILRF